MLCIIDGGAWDTVLVEVCPLPVFTLHVAIHGRKRYCLVFSDFHTVALQVISLKHTSMHMYVCR